MEDRPRTRAPYLRALLVGALVLAVPGIAWAHTRSERLEVQQRAAQIASTLSNRSIDVNCPGPIRRRMLREIHEGSVRFDADGVPADETRLSARTCDGLRDVLDRGAALDFACLASSSCSADEQRAADALAVVTHEIMHLRGTIDEGRAECQARLRVAFVATRLGITAQAAERLAAWQATAGQERLPERYQGGVC